MTLIKKLFIKNYKDTKNPAVRVKYGMVASLFGIVTNILLFLSKLFIGIISGSITITADAINNLLDSSSSLITLLGFKFASKPADKEHPYGHARYEYVASFLVAITILVVGALLAIRSFEKMLSPSMLFIDIWTYVVLLMSIIVKIIQIAVYRNFGKEINSNALITASVDARNDIIISAAVIITAVFGSFGINVDGVMGLCVSVFIIFSSIILVKDNISVLVGKAPDKALTDKIKQIILSFSGVLGVHDLHVHSYGEGNVFVAGDVEVCSQSSLVKAHELIDGIEKKLFDELAVNAILHIDPVCNHKSFKTLKRQLEELLVKYDKRFAVHDFWINDKHEVDFHLEIPFECEKSDQEIIEYVTENFKVNSVKVVVDRV